MRYDNFEAPAELGRWQTIALGIGGILSLLMLGAMAFFPDSASLLCVGGF